MNIYTIIKLHCNSHLPENCSLPFRRWIPQFAHSCKLIVEGLQRYFMIKLNVNEDQLISCRNVGCSSGVAVSTSGMYSGDLDLFPFWKQRFFWVNFFTSEWLLKSINRIHSFVDPCLLTLIKTLCCIYLFKIWICLHWALTLHWNTIDWNGEDTGKIS